MASNYEQQNNHFNPPFARLLDIRAGESANGIGKVFMKINPNHLQSAGVVQGGLIVTLADYALFLAVDSVVEPGTATVTVELKLNFLEPARDGELTATAKVVSPAGRIIVAEMHVTDDRQSIIAQGLGTSMVVTRRS